MATTKKAPAKKPAAKKPAAKATKTAKKPAAKAAAKKPAVKVAAKKSVAKADAKKSAAKAAVKKTVAKAEKKPVTKTAAKKPAVRAEVKKPAAKPAPAKKTEVKAEAKKPAAKPTPVKKTVVKAEPAVAEPKNEAEEDVKVRNLFDAFAQGKLPLNQGYIVSSFFNDTSAYSIYEIVSYSGVKEIFITETGLQFVTGGKKLYILLEPDTYPLKYQEPVSRKDDERIPKRFSELEIITAKNQSKIMVAKEPNETYGSFTILKPQGTNFSVLFYEADDVYETLASFFEESLNKQRKIPQADAKKAAQLISATVEKYMSFKSEFE
jgi:hypothetical protein